MPNRPKCGSTGVCCLSEAPVDIVPYDPFWPARFDEEREQLVDAIGAWLVGPVEHIGSTAVLGLPAKPVIDIMAGVQTLDATRPPVTALAELGYCYAPYRSDSEHWFCKPSPAFRTHHLHLVPFGSLQWTEALAFRDTCAHITHCCGVCGSQTAFGTGIPLRSRGLHPSQGSVYRANHRPGSSGTAEATNQFRFRSFRADWLTSRCSRRAARGSATKRLIAPTSEAKIHPRWQWQRQPSAEERKWKAVCSTRLSGSW